MIKKRLFLALIAMSMSLAGCDNVNKNPGDETQEDGSGSGSGDAGAGGDATGGDTDSGAGGDPTGGDEGNVDKLTPEQRANANNLKDMINVVLALPERYQNETIEACGEYTLAYAEEITLEGVQYSALVSLVSMAMPLANDQSPEAIVKFIGDVKEEGKLKDVAYFGTAVGKAFIRAEAKSNEQFGHSLGYVAGLVDKEGAKMHANVYNVVDALAGAAVEAFDADFTAAYNGVFTYDQEKDLRQIDGANLKATVDGVADITNEFVKAQSGITYLVKFLLASLKSYAKDVIELDDETIAYVDYVDADAILGPVFGGLTFVGRNLKELAGEENETVEYLATVANMLFAEQYMELVEKLITDFLGYLGFDEEALGQVANVASELFAGVSQLIRQTIENISGSFSVDEELEEPELLFDRAKFEEAIEDLGKALENFLDAKRDVKALIDFVKEVVKSTLIKVAHYDEEEAAALVEKVHTDEMLDDIFDAIEDASAFLQDVPAEYIDLIEGLVTSNYLFAAVSVVRIGLHFIGDPVEADALLGNIAAVVLPIYVVIRSLGTDDFKALVSGIVNKETGNIDEEGLNTLLSTLSTYLKAIGKGSKYAEDLVDQLVLIAKAVLVKIGYEEEVADKMVSDEMLIEVFAGFYGTLAQTALILDAVVDPEDHNYDFFVEAFTIVANDLLAHNIPQAIQDVIAIAYNFLGVANDEDINAMVNGVMGLFGIVGMLVEGFTDDSFLDGFMAILNLEKFNFDVDALIAFVQSIGSILDDSGIATAGLLIDIVFCQVKVLYKGVMMTFGELSSEDAAVAADMFGSSVERALREALNDMLVSYQMSLDDTLSEEDAQALVNEMTFDQMLTVLFGYVDVVIQYLKAYGTDDEHGKLDMDALKELNTAIQNALDAVDKIAEDPEIVPSKKFGAILEVLVELAQDVCDIQRFEIPVEVSNFFNDNETIEPLIKALTFFFAFLNGEKIDEYEIDDIIAYLPPLEDVKEALLGVIMMAGAGASYLFPYLDEFAGIYGEFYEIYEAVLEEFDLEEVEEIELFNALFTNVDLVESIIRDVILSLISLYGAFVAPEEGEAEIDFTKAVYNAIFFGEYPLNQFPEERFEQFKILLADVYALAAELGMAKLLVNFFARYIGGDVSEIDTSEEFVDYVYDYVADYLVIPAIA